MKLAIVLFVMFGLLKTLMMLAACFVALLLSVLTAGLVVRTLTRPVGVK